VRLLALAVDHPAVDKLGDARRHHLGMQSEVMLLVEGARTRQVHPRLPDADLDRRAVGDDLANVSGDRLRDLRWVRDTERAAHLQRRHARHRRPNHDEPVQVVRDVVDDRQVFRL
jgi:hypothetical protein